MPSRRQFLTVAAASIGLSPLLAWVARGHRGAALQSATFPETRSDAAWRASLSPAAYAVLRQEGTERPFSSPLLHESAAGLYVCAGCGHPVFTSQDKFDSGTGWPSFTRPVSDAVGTTVDDSWFMVRTAVHCARCGGHLGHVFSDGPAPTGLRYCMNGVALRFVAGPAGPVNPTGRRG